MDYKSDDAVDSKPFSVQDHCRLCGEIKFPNELIDHQSSVAVDKRLTEKLYKIDIHISENDNLPRSVCGSCFDELERTVLFLDKVEQVQKKFADTPIDIKPGVSSQKVEEEEVNAELIKSNCLLEPMKDSHNTKNDTTLDYEIKSESNCDEFEEVENWSNSDDSESDISDTQPLKFLRQEKMKLKKVDSKKQNEPKLLDLTWKEYSWVCSTCATDHKTIESLKEHTKSAHGACPTYKCIDCNIKRFVNHKTFIKHVCTHRSSLQLCCFVCSNTYKSLASLKKHFKNMHETEFTCRVCGEIFNNKDDLKTHLQNYGKYLKPIKLLPEDLVCKYCGKHCKNGSNLKVHVATHEDRSREHTCHLCGKAFYNKGTLTAHLDAHADKRPFACHLCEKRFPTKNKLQRHVDTHSDFKPFACPTCGRMFRNKYQLKYHTIVHTDEMPFACPYCEKRFKFKSVWKTHQNQHTGNRPYECVECSHQFANQSNYIKHMLRRHGVKIGGRRNNVKPDPTNQENAELTMNNSAQ